jgi:putative aldouronate transport system substrate-binding protein
MKKIVILGILAVILTALIFAGGNQQKSGAQATDDPNQHYTFTFSMLNWGQLYGTDFNSDAVAQYLQKKFNFDWDVTITTWEDWYQKPVLWVTSGDMPDLVFTNFNFNDYKSWTEQDLLKRLPDGWQQKYPNLARLQESTIVAPAVEKKVPGNPATLLNATFSIMPTKPRIADHNSLIFRKDWARALGMEIKDRYTLQEFVSMVEKFQAQGYSLPGITKGRTEAWNLDTGYALSAFLSSQWPEYGSFTKDPSGKYVWGPDDPKTLELLKYMKSAIDRSVISQNFVSFKNREQDQLFLAGQAFAIYSHHQLDYMYGYMKQFQENTGLDPTEYLQVALLTDPKGNYNSNEVLNFWSCLYFNPALSDAKFARLLSLLDYVGSAEGQDLVRMGIEGKDYTRNGNSITITLPKDVNGNFEPIYKVYPGAGVYSHITICSDDYAVRDPSIPQKYRDISEAMYALKQKIGVDTGTITAYDFDRYFFSGPNYLKFNADVGAELVRVAMMDGNLEVNYKNWLTDMHKVVDPVLTELNAAYGK